MANFAAADQAGLIRIIKRKLKKIQYRPHLINGCLWTITLFPRGFDQVIPQVLALFLC
jgi:hypothetical protein